VPDTLPCGAQNTGETLLQTLHRRCLQELSTEIITGEILYLADYSKQKLQENSYLQHQLEILIPCQIADSYSRNDSPKHHKYQIAKAWISIDKLPQIAMYAVILKQILTQLIHSANPVYPGNIN